jgi:hypothetical protein
MTPGQAIRRAAAELRTRGWIKGAAADAEERHCLWGAVLCATPGALSGAVRKKALIAVDRVAVEQYPERGDHSEHPMIGFNDHPATTLDDVLAVLDKAAVRADETDGAV